MTDEWIAMSWQHKDDHTNMRGGSVTIHRMNSPFYEGEKFAIRDGSSVLSVYGEWEFEPSPSNRDDEFYVRCRFDTFEHATTAALIARKHAHNNNNANVKEGAE